MPHPYRFGFPRVPAGPVVLGLAVLTACDSSSPGAPAPDADLVCPADVASAIGAPCDPGLVCAPEYSCGIYTVTATCTCMGGHFACADRTGQALVAGTVPACPPRADASASCPPTESTARTVNCSLAGLQCAYPSSCPIQRDYDSCQCFPLTTPDGGTALRFSCPDPCQDASAPEGGGESADASEEPPATPPPEASAPDAPRDAPSPPPDAQADAQGASDARQD